MTKGPHRWRECVERAEAAATENGGVLSRAQLRDLGIDRHMESRQVESRRWRRHGRQSIAVHTGELDEVAARWRALHEVGGDAVVDGVSALLAAGVTGLPDDAVHVSVHHLARAPRVPGVVVHKVSRRVPAEAAAAKRESDALPQTPPALATLRAAQWAVSDRQAALFLVLPVQQRVVRAERLLEMHEHYPGRRRRAVVRQLLLDIADGAHSLGELDFAAMCRRRGIPEPTRQSLVRTGRGRCYLDVRWDRIGLVVEIDGTQHVQGLNRTRDHLRDNALALRDDTVLRIDLVGLRLEESAFMDQVVMAHQVLTARAGG